MLQGNLSPQRSLQEQETVLNRIVRDKAVWVEARQSQQPLESFQASIVPSSRSFYDALSGNRTAFILECKRHHPLKV